MAKVYGKKMLHTEHTPHSTTDSPIQFYINLKCSTWFAEFNRCPGGLVKHVTSLFEALNRKGYYLERFSLVPAISLQDIFWQPPRNFLN